MKKVAPGVYEEGGRLVYVTDEMEPGYDYGPDVFVGDLNSPEAAVHFRRIDGGPADISHIPRYNADGWLLEGFEPPPDCDGYRMPLPGHLKPTRAPHGWEWGLLSVGDVFRGPDHHHYQPVHAIARTHDRANELHWLTGFAPVHFGPNPSFYLFRGHLVSYVGGPNWPR